MHALEYVKDKNYAQFDARSYHYYGEVHFNVIFYGQMAKGRSRLWSHIAFSKSMSRTITIQVDTHIYSYTAEKHILMQLVGGLTDIKVTGSRSQGLLQEYAGNKLGGD